MGRQHAIDWGKAFKEPAPDDWRQWPPVATAFVAAAFDRARATLRAHTIVSDTSGCTARDDGRFLLWRKMIVEEA